MKLEKKKLVHVDRLQKSPRKLHELLGREMAEELQGS
jgi:hypothetical protein